VIASDPSDQQQQAQEEKKSGKGDDNDDGSADAALGLINTGPVQLKTDLEQPVTSGGMDVFDVITEPSN
jgi:hypothetical protein